MTNRFLILLFSFMTLSSLTGYSQNFEGVIYGVTSYTSKIDSLSAEELYGQKFSLDETYIKDGFFLVRSSTDFMTMMLWRSEDTTLYWFNKSSADTLWYDRTDSHPASIVDYYFVENADSVAGYACDALVILRENGSTVTYFYSSELALDPDYYKDCSNSAKYEVMQKIKSIYLKLVIESSFGIMESTALKVEWKELPDEFFALPSHSVLIEANY